MKKSDTILLSIGAGSVQTPGIIAAQKKGLSVVAVDGDADAPGFGVADFAYVVDVKDYEAIVQIASKHQVSGVLAVASDICLVAAAHVTEALNLPGMTPKEIEPVTDKAIMRDCIGRHQVPSPRYKVVMRDDNCMQAAQHLVMPIVVKPADSAGSRGVTYVTEAGQLEEAFHNALKYSQSGKVLYEEFMEGPEISVEGFVLDKQFVILTLSDKVRTRPPYLLDISVTFPSALSQEDQEKVKAVATQAVEATGIDNCPVHMELILTGEGPKIVEMAARGPGFNVYSDIIPYVTGVNGIDMQIDLLLGSQVECLRPQRLKGAHIVFFSSDKRAKVTDVQGVAEASAQPGIHDLAIYVKPGDQVAPLSCGSDRLGHVIAFGDDRADAVSKAEHAYSMVAIELEPLDTKE